ncbi:MAG: protein kinase domain-containing protein [Prochlorotrichaceae cyanobacterium]
MGHPSSPGFQARTQALRNTTPAQQQSPNDRRQDKKPPILMNRYQLIKVLGRGGFGVTALAQDSQLPGKPYCVIKQLRPQVQDQDTFIRARHRFQREAKTLANLGGHAQIPMLLNYFEQQGQFFLVQEFIPGQTLTQKVKVEGPLPEPVVLSFLQNILPVLDYVHQHGVIHRDLKPSNIMQCNQDDRLVLLDFGAMKSALASEETSLQITRQFIGTPGFAPPEQQQLRPCFASDLYALGMTCLFLLSGHWPQSFSWDKRRQCIQWTEKISVSQPFASILNHLLMTDLTQRYRSVEEVLNSLSKIVKEPLPTPSVASSPAANSFTDLQDCLHFQSPQRRYVTRNKR